MRAVWSLWTKPLLEGPGDCWIDLKANLLSWILSFETVRDLGKLFAYASEASHAKVEDRVRSKYPETYQRCLDVIKLGNLVSRPADINLPALQIAQT